MTLELELELELALELELKLKKLANRRLAVLLAPAVRLRKI